jgi:hypothetical protein
MSQNKSMNEQDIVRTLKNEHFDSIECDISVPENLREKSKVSKMSPIFKNTLVGHDNISPHMGDFAEKYKMPNTPQRMLIGSLHGEKILLLTPLGKWYLSHGL